MAEDRGEAMAARVERAVRRAGLDAYADPMAYLFRAVLKHRSTVIEDPEHPDFLHPGRTVLILLEDLRSTDPDTLLAAPLRDSEQPEADLPDERALRLAGPRAAAIAAALPAAGSDDGDRLEALVSLDPESLLVALAERLDHARHLHLRAPESWAPFHRQIGAADLPAAARSHPRLAMRLESWHERFARRFLRPAQ